MDGRFPHLNRREYRIEGGGYTAVVLGVGRYCPRTDLRGPPIIEVNGNPQDGFLLKSKNGFIVDFCFPERM